MPQVAIKNSSFFFISYFIDFRYARYGKKTSTVTNNKKRQLVDLSLFV